MEKDFSKWMSVKQYVHDVRNRPFYHEREIWWCSIGLNVGFEIDGKGAGYTRPVLILKDFNHSVFWGIPVTTRIRDGAYYLDIDLKDGVARQVALTQIHFTDAKRLKKKLGMVDEEVFIKIKRAISAFLVDDPSSILPASKAFADEGDEAEAIILLPPLDGEVSGQIPKIDS